MSANQVIDELKALPTEDREEVYRWLQADGLRSLFRRADEILNDSPRYAEEEILSLPRVRPSGF